MITVNPVRGRDREWMQIVDTLTHARAGDRAVLVIEGAQGMGRTRLLRELVAKARADGWVTFDHSGSMPPALVGLVATDRTGPVLVAWDDPQWTDTGPLPGPVPGPVSGPLPGPLPAPAPILWALTRRTIESPSLRVLLETVSTVICVELGPVPDRAVGEIMTDLLGAPPSAELLALAAAAAGNPHAIVDLVAGLTEEGLVATSGGTAQLVSRALPRRLRARVRRQLDRLSQPTRRLVQVASIVGPPTYRTEESRTPEPIRLPELARLLGDTAVGLLSAVEEALASGLLVCVAERLAFSHELVREIVAESVPLAVRDALRTDALPLHRMGWESLSERERTIAELIGQALTNRQIASRVFLSPHTVNYHLRQIYRKLDINSRVHLAQLAQAGPASSHPASAS